MASTDLSKGSKPEIKEFQQAMNLLKHTGTDNQPLTVDGIWGRNTRTAVKKFQEENNLSPDGIAGIETVEALVSSPKLSNEKPNTVVPPKANSTGGMDQLPSVAPAPATQGASTASTAPATKTTANTEPKPVDPATAERQKAVQAMQAKAAQKAKAQQSAQKRVVKADPHGEEQAGGVGPKPSSTTTNPTLQYGQNQKKIKKDAPKAKVSTDPAGIYNTPHNFPQQQGQYKNKQEAMHVLQQIYKQYKAARQQGDKKTLTALLPRVVAMNTRAQNIHRLNPGIKNLSVKLKNLLDKSLSESYNNINEGVWDSISDTASSWFKDDNLVGEEEADAEYNQFGFKATPKGIKIVSVPSIGAEIKLTRKDYFGLGKIIPYEWAEQFVKDGKGSAGYRKVFAKLLKGAPKKEPIEKKIANLTDEAKQQAFEIRDSVVNNINNTIKSLGFNAEKVPSTDAESYNLVGKTIEKTQTLLNTYQETAEHDDLVAAVNGYNELVASVQQYADNLA